MAVAQRLKPLFSALPYSMQMAVKWGVRKPAKSKRDLQLAWDKYRIVAAGRSGKSVRLADFDVRINDVGVAPYDLYEDIFLHDVYGFEAQRPNPRILDCGGNIGMSVLYFKMRYPEASIVAFEPDPTIIPFLHDNITRNGLKDVEVVNAALAAEPGTLKLNSDGGVGSHLEGYDPGGGAAQWTTFEVPCVQLSDYLNEPVDFMKMNIEGAEYEVLSEAESRLSQIREMNVEYHRLPGVPCTLHKILELLHRNGFTYVVSDFGIAMYGSARPSIQLDSAARFWRQIYASRSADLGDADFSDSTR